MVVSSKLIEKKAKAFILNKGKADKFSEVFAYLLSHNYDVENIENADELNQEQIQNILEIGNICVIHKCTRTTVNILRSKLSRKKIIFCTFAQENVSYLYKYLSYKDLSNIDLGIFLSETLYYYFGRLFILKKAGFTYIPVINFSSRSRHKVQNFKNKVAVITDLTNQVNIQILLQCIRELNFNNKNYEFFILFEDSEPFLENYLKQKLKDLYLQGKVNFVNISYKDLSCFLADKKYAIYIDVFGSKVNYVYRIITNHLKVAIIYEFPQSRKIFENKNIFFKYEECQKIFSSSGSYNINFERAQEKTIKFSEDKKKFYDYFLNPSFCIEKRTLNIAEELISKTHNPKPVDNLTILIPHYNRSKFLIEDLRAGHKLGKQRKIIVDDFSETNQRERLKNFLEQEGNTGIEKLIFNERNEKVNQVVNTLCKVLDTKYGMILADDDKLFVLDTDLLQLELSELEKDYFVLIPRLAIGLKVPENEIFILYDRSCYSDKTGKEILEIFLKEGIIRHFFGGATFKDIVLKETLVGQPFYYTEDYAKLALILSKNLGKKALVSDNIVAVYRIHSGNSWNSPELKRLFDQLLGIAIMVYYAIKEGIISKKTEFEKILLGRGKTLQEVFGFGYEESKFIAKYIFGEVTFNEFLEYAQRFYPFTLEPEKFCKEIFELYSCAKFLS